MPIKGRCEFLWVDAKDVIVVEICGDYSKGVSDILHMNSESMYGKTNVNTLLTQAIRLIWSGADNVAHPHESVPSTR